MINEIYNRKKKIREFLDQKLFLDNKGREGGEYWMNQLANDGNL
jgi:hypothetical protein